MDVSGAIVDVEGSADKGLSAGLCGFPKAFPDVRRTVYRSL
jgi:hypothetical protein